MKIINLVLSSYETNTYIIIEEDSAIVIDPAANPELILDTIKKENAGNVKIEKILLTHGHFDHTAAVFGLKQATGAQVYIHENDAEMLTDREKSFARLMQFPFTACEADVKLNGGEKIANLTVMHTPGHTSGSVMYIYNNIIFSGDTFFQGEIGRTDIGTGDMRVMMGSLKAIKSMQGDYRILPGHGEETTLADELRTNPYLS